MKFAEVFGPLAYIIKVRVEGLRDFGPCISPFNSFLFIQGIETLKFRMEAHSRNALAVAEWLEKQPAVTWVKYPGLKSSPYHAHLAEVSAAGQGSIVTFGIKGGTEAGRKLIDNVKIFSHLANLGDAKSLIIHPASTTHQQLSDAQQLEAGVTQGPGADLRRHRRRGRPEVGSGAGDRRVAGRVDFYFDAFKKTSAACRARAAASRSVRLQSTMTVSFSSGKRSITVWKPRVLPVCHMRARPR